MPYNESTDSESLNRAYESLTRSIRQLLDDLQQVSVSHVKYTLFLELIDFHLKIDAVPPVLQVDIQPLGFNCEEHPMIWNEWKDELKNCSKSLMSILRHHYVNEINHYSWLKSSIKRQVISSIMLEKNCSREVAVAFVDDWVERSVHHSINELTGLFYTRRQSKYGERSFDISAYAKKYCNRPALAKNKANSTSPYQVSIVNGEVITKTECPKKQQKKTLQQRDYRIQRSYSDEAMLQWDEEATLEENIPLQLKEKIEVGREVRRRGYSVPRPNYPKFRPTARNKNWFGARKVDVGSQVYDGDFSFVELVPEPVYATPTRARHFSPYRRCKHSRGVATQPERYPVFANYGMDDLPERPLLHYMPKQNLQPMAMPRFPRYYDDDPLLPSFRDDETNFRDYVFPAKPRRSRFRHDEQPEAYQPPSRKPIDDGYKWESLNDDSDLYPNDTIGSSPDRNTSPFNYAETDAPQKHPALSNQPGEIDSWRTKSFSPEKEKISREFRMHFSELDDANYSKKIPKENGNLEPTFLFTSQRHSQDKIALPLPEHSLNSNFILEQEHLHPAAQPQLQVTAAEAVQPFQESTPKNIFQQSQDYREDDIVDNFLPEDAFRRNSQRKTLTLKPTNGLKTYSSNPSLMKLINETGLNDFLQESQNLPVNGRLHDSLIVEEKISEVLRKSLEIKPTRSFDEINPPTKLQNGNKDVNVLRRSIENRRATSHDLEEKTNSKTDDESLLEALTSIDSFTRRQSHISPFKNIDKKVEKKRENELVKKERKHQSYLDDASRHNDQEFYSMNELKKELLDNNHRSLSTSQLINSSCVLDQEISQRELPDLEPTDVNPIHQSLEIHRFSRSPLRNHPSGAGPFDSLLRLQPVKSSNSLIASNNSSLGRPQTDKHEPVKSAKLNSAQSSSLEDSKNSFNKRGSYAPREDVEKYYAKKIKSITAVSENLSQLNHAERTFNSRKNSKQPDISSNESLVQQQNSYNSLQFEDIDKLNESSLHLLEEVKVKADKILQKQQDELSNTVSKSSSKFDRSSQRISFSKNDNVYVLDDKKLSAQEQKQESNSRKNLSKSSSILDKAKELTTSDGRFGSKLEGKDLSPLPNRSSVMHPKNILPSTTKRKDSMNASPSTRFSKLAFENDDALGGTKGSSELKRLPSKKNSRAATEAKSEAGSAAELIKQMPERQNKSFYRSKSSTFSRDISDKPKLKHISFEDIYFAKDKSKSSPITFAEKSYRPASLSVINLRDSKEEVNELNNKDQIPSVFKIHGSSSTMASGRTSIKSEIDVNNESKTNSKELVGKSETVKSSLSINKSEENDLKRQSSSEEESIPTDIDTDSETKEEPLSESLLHL